MPGAFCTIPLTPAELALLEEIAQRLGVSSVAVATAAVREALDGWVASEKLLTEEEQRALTVFTAVATRLQPAPPEVTP